MITKSLLLLLPLPRGKSDQLLFSVNVDFQNEYRNKLGSLHHSDTYTITDKAGKNSTINISELQALIEISITRDLKEVIEQLLDQKLVMKIRLVQEGSLQVWFAAILGAYYGVSKYKIFFDSCELIRRQCKKIIDATIEKTFGRDIFDVEVRTELPNPGTVWNRETEPSQSTGGLFYFFLSGFIILLVFLVLIISYLIIKFQIFHTK